MSPAETVTTFLEALEKGDLDEVASYLSDGFTFSGPTPRPLDRAQFLEFVGSMRRAFPNLVFNPTDLREQGSTVLLTLRITGAQSGELVLPVPGMPMVPATGRRIALPEEPARITVHSGKVSAFSVQPVQGGGILGVLHQLGVRLPVRTV
jgi:predicted ester cyclase